MSDLPIYVSSSLALNFPRQKDVRRKFNDFEDILKEEQEYQQPQIMPVPDDFDPAVPRLVSISQDGLSQIVITQINITLNTNYPPECQTDKTEAESYLLSKSHTLCALTEILEEVKLCYFGLTSVVRLRSDLDDRNISQMSKLLQQVDNQADINDISVKVTSVVLGRFFSNVTWKNYRLWRNTVSGPERLPNANADECGIEILVDFNDRYKYNEDPEYFSKSDVVAAIIENSFNEISKSIEKIRGL